MLSCEVEDILHWGSIGAVKLYLMVDEDHYAEIGNHANFVSDVKKAPAAGYNRPFQKCYRINPFLDAIVTENNPTEPEILLAGLCQIHRQFIEFAYNQPVDTPLNEWVCLIHGDWATEYYTLWHNEALTPTDLYLTKAELSVLYQAISTGKTLRNRYENYDIAERSALEKAVVNAAREDKTERNSSGRAETTLSLIELALTAVKLDRALIDNPYKLYTEINNNLRQHDLAEIQISDRAFADMLGVAKSSRIARQSKLTN